MTLAKPPWNVVVFPAASEIGLEIHRALAPLKETIVHGAQQPGPNVAAFHFARLHDLPTIDSDACLPALQRLIATHKIDAVFPAHDDVVVWLARHAAALPAKIIAPDLAVCELCRSKRATYEKFATMLTVPRLYPRAEDVAAFPVFVKPDRGNASRRARRIDDCASLQQALATEPDLIVMENLAGAEYTVDCFSQNGRLLFAKARRRLEIRSGIASLTEAADLACAPGWAEHISITLGLNGAWFFQIKQDGAGKPHLLEIAPRIAGSMAASRVTGPNFPLLSLYAAFGYPVTMDAAALELPMGRSLDLRFRYDRPIDALYIDLDDTLILRNAVNSDLVALIFQLHNRGTPVHLITRHRGDLAQMLARFRLSGLFNRIIHIANDAEAKADYITEKNALLVDDSFQERHAAAQRGIVCFDAAAAVCLIDRRS